MENSLLVGLSRQTALARQLDVIANNMANMRTAGYKTQSLIFEEFVMPTAQINDARLGDQKISYVLDRGMSRDFSPGEFQKTGNPLNVAIDGKGYLVVETPEGERYTRDGGLQLNNQGQLVTSAGYPLLGEGGPIVFGPQETGITIALDGTVSSDVGVKGQLRLVQFEQESLLKQEGANIFSTDQPPAEAQDARILQGMIEGSNVKPVIETARMIEVTRAYVNTSKLMNNLQELRQNAISDLAEVPA